MSDDFSRRAFLAGAGSLAFSPAQGAPNSRTAVGMIAVGARAHQLLDAMKKVPGVEITAVFDAYKGRMNRAIERAGGRPRAVKDYREILADKSIDAVTIASPDHWHARQTIEALEAGKHVFCEKPLTYSVDEGLAVAKAVERSGKSLVIGSQGVSSQTQQLARSMIREGRLGRVTMIRAYYNRNSASGAWIYPIPPDASPETVDWDLFLGSAPKRPFDLERFFRWRCYEDYSGGIATDLFVHLCTTIHYLMDATMPSEVTAMGDLYRWADSRDVPDTLNAILRYPEGFTVNLSSTFNNGSAGAGFEFLGTEGSLSVGYRSLAFTPESVHENNNWIVESWPKTLQEAYERRNPEESRRPPKPEPEEHKERGPGDTQLHLQGFFDTFRAKAENVEDVWAGHHAAACAHLINDSARKGRIARWDFGQKRQKEA
jgi:predicted dehydrogenase